MADDFVFESFWDLAYREGDHLEHWESPHPPQELVAMVAAGLIPAEGTVLDVGCGAGGEALFLAALGFRTIGVDSSAEAIELARRQAVESGLEVDFRVADATGLPLADESIDFAIDRGCFHVIDRDQREDYVRELQRVLRHGASFLLRGAAADDEEEGVIGVDVEEIDRVFVCGKFTRGPVVPLAMVARSGVLEGHVVLLQRKRRTASHTTLDWREKKP